MWAPPVHEAFGGLAQRLRQDDALAQFGRFVLVGGSSSLLYVILYVLLDGMGGQPANVVAAAISSVVANESHRRLTFHAEARVSWFAAQWEGGSIAVVGIVATTLALGWLDRTSSTSSVLTELALVGAVTATIGTLRFIALRWLFAPRAHSRA